MICPRCGAPYIQAQAVSDTYTRPKRKGIIWWCVIGWWWVILKWTIFALPALILSIFRRKPVETVTRTKTVCVCQSCGHVWRK